MAAFRIASEALTNVVRHAAADPRHRACSTAVRRGSCVEVTDDGRGIGPDVVAGRGTLSMRERAAELGGALTVAPARRWHASSAPGCPAGGCSGDVLRVLLADDHPVYRDGLAGAAGVGGRGRGRR